MEEMETFFLYFSAEDSDATVLAVKVENKKPEGPLSEISKENSKETNEVAEGQNAESEEPSKPSCDPPSGSGSSDSDSTSSDSGSENDDLKDLDYGARPERRNKSNKKSSKKKSKKKSKKRSKDKAKEKENSEPSVKKDTSEQNSKSDRQDSSEERSDLPQDKIGGGSNSPTTQQVIDKVIRETVDDESSEEGVNEVREANSIQIQLGTRISTKKNFTLS